MGPPIRTHIPFSLAHHLQTANEEAVAREDAGEVSEDDGNFEEDAPDPTTERPCTPPSRLYGPLLSLSPLDELTDSEWARPIAFSYHLLIYPTGSSQYLIDMTFQSSYQ